MRFLAFSPWLAWLLVTAAAGAAAILFAIRPRPPRLVVSSLIVWRRVLDDAIERSWWDRVRWFVSLGLTVSIAVAIAAAFARPARGSRASASGRVLIVLDSSWSMRARTASGTTRWEQAIQAAQAIAAASSGGEVALATSAEGVIEGPTSDMALVQSAFSRLRPSGGVDGAWPQVAGVSAVHFVTDGALARVVPSDVVLHSVFAPVPNVAITAFDVQPSGGSEATSTVFLAVANHASTPQAVRVAVGRAADVLFDRSITVQAGETHREILTVPSGGAPRFRAHVSAAQNQLDIDDDATAWLWTAEPLRVAVVGGSGALPTLLARDASLRVTAVDRADYGNTKTDVWIFDGWLPAQAPSKPALVIDPPASAWLGTRGPEEIGPVWAAGSTHAILDGVDMTLVHVRHARAVIRPTLRPIAMSEQGTPLIAIEDGRADWQIVFAFAVADSNLAVTPAFPILMGNAIDWLGRPERDLHRPPGPTMLPSATVRVVAPDGRSLPLTRLDDRVRVSLDEPGLYLVQSADGQRVIRVTLGDTRRSNLLVSSLPDTRSPLPPGEGPGRSWWVYATIAALTLVALEWMTWQRRITV
jgi:hypothetical protein